MNPAMKPTDFNQAYYYLYGRNQLYRYLSAPDPSEPEPYTFRDDIMYPHPGKKDEGPQTVEQLVKQGYFAVPRSDPETGLLSDRKQTAWLGLDDVIDQVRNRLEIYRKNWVEIEQAKCAARNALFEFEAQYGWPASSEQHYIMDKRLQDLYADQRAERVAVWKDVSRLRQSLPETVQSYLTAYRKVQILEDPGGDPP